MHPTPPNPWVATLAIQSIQPLPRLRHPSRYRRTVFDWEKWREHRSTERYVRHMRSMTSVRGWLDGGGGRCHCWHV